jgi:hypothetical protein
MKSNFKPSTSDNYQGDKKEQNPDKKVLTKEEFEEYILKSGAKGSFMIYRSKNSDDELGIDEL